VPADRLLARAQEIAGLPPLTSHYTRYELSAARSSRCEELRRW
jgi:hypothetical protein